MNLFSSFPYSLITSTVFPPYIGGGKMICWREESETSGSESSDLNDLITKRTILNIITKIPKNNTMFGSANWIPPKLI